LNERLQVPPAVAAHGRAVADLALHVGRALKDAGFYLDLDLIRAAALVHDMARGRSNHDRRGADILRDLNMPLMAAIVGNHMNISWSEEQPIREAEVVFLADKLVQEDRIVGLDARFAKRMSGYSSDSQAWHRIRRRLSTARNIAERIEALTGESLKSLRNGSRPAYVVKTSSSVK
jgi:hypothetical protein